VINTEKTPLSETVDLFSPAEAEETQTDKSQILEVTSAVGKVYQTELTDLKLSDRASNGHPLAEDIDRVLEAKIK
jgi:topoisomerase-4 subunit A